MIISSVFKDIPSLIDYNLKWDALFGNTGSANQVAFQAAVIGQTFGLLTGVSLDIICYLTLSLGAQLLRSFRMIET